MGDLSERLKYIDPDESYYIWITVGMALKREGYDLETWRAWSRHGAKYHEGECEKKWNSFQEGTETLVTGATITQLAKERGWKPSGGEIISFNAILTDDDLKIIDPSFIDGDEFKEPPLEKWDPVADAINYLKALFKPDEYVGFSFKATDAEKDGKHHPIEHGLNKRTQAEIIEDLKKYKNIHEAICTPNYRDAGAWVRINPLDGQGGKNSNVTDFRFALVESDNMPLEKQLSFFKALQLPVAALVYSGGKSIHGIVHIDADTYKEYQQRVDRLYKLCNKNGFTVDIQNKNPSRFSRFPGVFRGKHKQFLIATNIGQPSFDDWIEWMQEQADDLPDFDDFQELANDLPELAPELIHGVLRQGHKLLLSGPSKAGKSFALIELAIAIVEGKEWFGFKCEAGNVLYINLEIDRASCLHRISNVYKSLGIEHTGPYKLMTWNLRGDAVPLDKLVSKIIRRAQKYDFRAVIVDPIYKVITGDENSAGEMAKFCNNFDRICKALGVSCIYCHHHSKGAQGNKRAMDRASGSGVFARDPDALIDIIPLSARKEDGYDATGFRVSGILREFAPFKSFGIWFDYPIHKVDTSGVLSMAAVEGSMEDLQEKGRDTQTTRKEIRKKDLIDAIEGALERNEKITLQELADMLNVTVKTIRQDFKEINEDLPRYKTGIGRNAYIERLYG